MKLTIEYVNKNDLKQYENNAKIHTDRQVDQIKKSIEQFGFNDPIAVWKDNEIIEGHGRLLAAMQMDNISEVPIIRLDNLTDSQRKAYALIHNKLTMNTDFDLETLDLELENLENLDLDLNLADFDFELTTINWDEVKEITKENYEKPESDKLRCPLCGGIDEKIRFVKVK